MKGSFIVIDGCDAAGKSTLARKLVDHLNGMGVEAILTGEPGGTWLGGQVRGFILSTEVEDFSPEVELMLLTAARRDHLEKVVYPNIEKGVTVICDRYTYSTYAYQGAGKGVAAWRINELEQSAEIIEPDLALLMDVPVEVAMERMAGRGQPLDKMEQNGQAFFEKIRASFIEQATFDPAITQLVDASQDEDSVLNDVLGRVMVHFSDRQKRLLTRTS